MTLNDIAAHAATSNDTAADTAFELWDGQRPIEILDNQGEDWKDKPIILSIDGLKINLTANQADAIRANLAASLLDYSERITPTFQGTGIGNDSTFFGIAGVDE